MSLLYGRCAWLRACLIELMGERRQVVLVLDDPACDLPDGWQSWTPWLSDSPNKFISGLVSNCDTLRDVVHTIKGIRGEIGNNSGTLCESFRAFLESWMKRPWLKSVEEGDYHYGEVGEDGIPPVAREWILTTNPAPVAKAESLMLMAKEIVLEERRLWDSLDAAWEKIEFSPPKQIGRPKLSGLPQWKPAIASILTMRATGVSYPKIAEALDSEFPELGPFNGDRVRRIYDRESARKKPTDPD